MTLYESCRLALPAVKMDAEAFERHVKRAFDLHRRKREKAGELASFEAYVETLHGVELYLASACLEGDESAWKALFASKTDDCLLLDALQGQSRRFYPRDEERQENAVKEFWTHLLVPVKDGTLATLERYDGQSRLVPWLIRVFQNLQISELRKKRAGPLPEDDLSEPEDDAMTAPDTAIIEKELGSSQSLRVEAMLEFIRFVLQGKPKQSEAIDGLLNHPLGEKLSDRQRGDRALIKKAVAGALGLATGASGAEFFSIASTLKDWLADAAKNPMSRREFCAVIAKLFGSGAFLMGDFSVPQSILSVDEMKHALEFTSNLRLRKGDIVNCRQFLDLLVENQLRLWNQSSQRTTDAEALMLLLDHHFSVALDGLSINLVKRDIQVMTSLLPRMGARRASAQRRVLQNEARRLFHTDEVYPAVGIAEQIVNREDPQRFVRQTMRDPKHSDDFNPMIQIFEVGTFLSGIRHEDCYGWWKEAIRQSADAGDIAGAARVEARMLASEAEDHPRDIGRALAHADRLQFLQQTVAEIGSNPLWRIQHQLAMLRCLIHAKKEPEAMAVFGELQSNILRLGYRQGAARLELACRLAVGPLAVLHPQAKAVKRLCHLPF